MVHVSWICPPPGRLFVPRIGRTESPDSPAEEGRLGMDIPGVGFRKRGLVVGRSRVQPRAAYRQTDSSGRALTRLILGSTLRLRQAKAAQIECPVGKIDVVIFELGAPDCRSRQIRRRRPPSSRIGIARAMRQMLPRRR